MSVVGRMKTATLKFLRELNFYTKHSTDPFEIQNGCIATRLYIVTLLAALVTLSVYTLSNEEIRQVIVVTPSLQTYVDLTLKIGKDNLICPCNEVSISYSKFMRIELLFHPICSSQFIEESWFDFLKSFDIPLTGPAEFSWNAFYQFQFVTHLCALAKTTAVDALQQFHQTKWVTSKVISEEVIEIAAMELIRTHISATINAFRRSADLALLIPKYQSLSVFLSTAQHDLYVDLDALEFPSETMNFLSYCVCAFLPTCKIYLRVTIPWNSIYYDEDGFVVKNLLTGCSFIKTFMASSLDCFFNQTCIDILQTFGNRPVSFVALPSNSSFAPNSTFKTIVDRMMVDSWYEIFNYSGFYNTCNPASCSYTLVERKNLVQLCVIIIGAFGGLNTALNLIIPVLVRFARGRGKKIMRSLQSLISRPTTVSVIEHPARDKDDI